MWEGCISIFTSRPPSKIELCGAFFLKNEIIHLVVFSGGMFSFTRGINKLRKYSSLEHSFSKSFLTGLWFHRCLNRWTRQVYTFTYTTKSCNTGDKLSLYKKNAVYLKSNSRQQISIIHSLIIDQEKTNRSPRVESSTFVESWNKSST